jgi:hypothetical protein
VRPVRLVLAVVVCALGAAASAQVRLEATVVDAETGEPLAGATAQVLGQGGGATADRDGWLSIRLPSLPDTVVVRFVGFATANVVVAEAEGDVVRRTVRLSPTPYVLGEVTVTGEPPGEVLWRRLLARRQSLAGRMGQYAAEGYSRLLLTRDGPTDIRPVPIALTEALSNLSWRAGRGLREEVVARRRLPDGGPFRWAGLEPLPDLYFEDVLWLDGRPVPSPTAPDALDHYAFRLGETVETGGRRFLDLAVIPRRGGLVAGRVRVVDTLLVIAEADLRADFRPGGSVDAFDAAYRWDYDPVWADAALRDSVWLPRRFHREGYVTASVPGYRVPTVRFRQTTALDLVVPHAAGQAARLGRRYRSPREVYGGHDVYRFGRAALPLDSLETAVEESDFIRRATLAEMLPRQEGIGFSFSVPGFRRSVAAPVEGEDDD